MYDVSPAIHLHATARELSAPVERPIPLTIALPPLDVSSKAFGPPKPLNAGVLSARINCVAMGLNPIKTVFGFSLIVSLTRYQPWGCLLYTSPSPRDRTRSRMPSSA